MKLLLVKGSLFKSKMNQLSQFGAIWVPKTKTSKKSLYSKNEI